MTIVYFITGVLSGALIMAWIMLEHEIEHFRAQQAMLDRIANIEREARIEANAASGCTDSMSM